MQTLTQTDKAPPAVASVATASEAEVWVVQYFSWRGLVPYVFWTLAHSGSLASVEADALVRCQKTYIIGAAIFQDADTDQEPILVYDKRKTISVPLPVKGLS